MVTEKVFLSIGGRKLECTPVSIPSMEREFNLQQELTHRILNRLNKQLEENVKASLIHHGFITESDNLIEYCKKTKPNVCTYENITIFFIGKKPICEWSEVCMDTYMLNEKMNFKRYFKTL